MDYLTVGNICSILDGVAVTLEECIHVVEVSITAIDEVTLIAVLPEGLTKREEIIIIFAANYRLTRCWWK